MTALWRRYSPGSGVREPKPSTRWDDSPTRTPSTPPRGAASSWTAGKLETHRCNLTYFPERRGPRIVQHQRIPGLNHEAGEGGQVPPIGLANGGGLARREKALLAPGGILPFQPHDATVPPAEPAAQIDVPGIPGGSQVRYPAAGPEGEIHHGGSQGLRPLPGGGSLGGSGPIRPPRLPVPGRRNRPRPFPAGRPSMVPRTAWILRCRL